MHERKALVDYNPFEARLSSADDELHALEQRRIDLDQQIEWAEHFDLNNAVKETERLRSDLREHTAELARLEERADESEGAASQAEAKTVQLERAARFDWNRFGWEMVKRWANEDIDRAKKQLKSHLDDTRRLRDEAQSCHEEVDACTQKITELSDELDERERAIELFHGLATNGIEREVAEIGNQLLTLARERDHLAMRSQDVEVAVEQSFTEFRKYQTEIDARESDLRRLESELSDLQSQIDGVERIRKGLSEATNGYEKAKLHEKCGRKFGHERPGDALREIRAQMQPLRKRIDENEYMVRRIRRDMAKTEDRIVHLAAAAAREIDSLVIDGSNCCFSEDNVFIGLSALIPMANSIASKTPVTVVFDASIRPQLGITDEEIRAQLPSATVYFAGAGTDADEMILYAADKPNVWVISNDRFSDYRHMAAVKNARVIRRIVLPDRVLVPDLRVDEPLL